MSSYSVQMSLCTKSQLYFGPVVLPPNHILALNPPCHEGFLKLLITEANQTMSLYVLHLHTTAVLLCFSLFTPAELNILRLWRLKTLRNPSSSSVSVCTHIRPNVNPMSAMWACTASCKEQVVCLGAVVGGRGEQTGSKYLYSGTISQVLFFP